MTQEKLTDTELADRQLSYDKMRETDGWKLLEARLEQLELEFAGRVGRDTIRATRPNKDSTMSEQMLESFVNVAYHRGIIRGMGLIVREPGRIEDLFNEAFKERIDA